MLNQQNNQRPDSTAPAQSKNNPLADTIREGAIAANIFVGTSKDGSRYHYFAVSRSWKNAEGNSGYSSSFYAKNCDALSRVIVAASERCEELDSATQKQRH